MDPMSEMATNADKLTNDLVVEILSGVPYKSFCRFKCVNKTWLSFSSDPHYHNKLPKAFAGGLLYQEHDSNAIKLTCPCPDDGSIDISLSFLPNYEQLELVDCCNGLILCEFGRSSSLPSISHLIVCNPVTRQWIQLPETQQEPGFHYEVKLAFDPSWSPHFYVFNFKQEYSPEEEITGVAAVGIFSSQNSTWYVDDRWNPGNEIKVTWRPHFFLKGVLYVQTSDDCCLVMETFPQTEGLPNHRIIELPGYKPSSPMNDCFFGCLGQSSGVLHYAKPAKDGCSIVVWSLEQSHWNLKHRLSMSDAFGRNIFVRQDLEGFWCCDYDIEVVDMDKGLIFIRDWCADKLVSYSMSTGRLNEIQDGFNRYIRYVPHYSVF